MNKEQEQQKIFAFLKANTGGVNLIKLLGVGNARFVGGCVRDLLIDKKSSDIDIATSLKPDEVIKVLEENNIKAIPTGIKHGTITALYKNKSFEITTLRRDEATDGRHATVAFSNSWEEDAKRRDFTINALYLDINGKLYDYFNGVADLQKGRVLFIGDAKTRIEEDYLRILRYFRFLQRFGNKPDEATLKVIEKSSHLIHKLSGERVWAELEKILSHARADETFKLMSRVGVVEAISGFKINASLLYNSSIENLVQILENEGQVESLSTRLKFSNHLKKHLTTMVFLKNNFPKNKINKVKVKQIAFDYGKTLAKSFISFIFVEDIKNFDNYIEYIKKLKIKPFPIRGEDLKKLGFKEGKEMGMVLQKLKLAWQKSNYKMGKRDLIKTLKS